MTRLVGFLGSCGTPYCGSIEGYFCVKCHRYVSECRCGSNNRGCKCNNLAYWASNGERKICRHNLLLAEGELKE